MPAGADLVEQLAEAGIDGIVAGGGSGTAVRHAPMVARMTRHCARCGVAGDAPEDGMPEGWSFDVTDRGVTYLCAACTREHVRSIEAKLDEEWW